MEGAFCPKNMCVVLCPILIVRGRETEAMHMAGARRKQSTKCMELFLGLAARK